MTHRSTIDVPVPSYCTVAEVDAAMRTFADALATSSFTAKLLAAGLQALRQATITPKLMGTDIHFFVEHRKTKTSSWQSSDRWTLDDPDEVSYNDSFYKVRNYNVFAILAGIRNAYDPADGSGYKAISPPRGLPPDLSWRLQDHAYASVKHTPSWLLLSELLAFDWSQKATEKMTITLEEYCTWMQFDREEGVEPKKLDCTPTDPAAVAAGVSLAQLDTTYNQLKETDPRWGRHSCQEQAVLLEAAIPYGNLEHDVAKVRTQLCLPVAEAPPKRLLITSVSYLQTYARAAARLTSETIPLLLALAHREAGGDYDCVRCVFWFDS